jgi:hypothetical protein
MTNVGFGIHRYASNPSVEYYENSGFERTNEVEYYNDSYFVESVY